MGVIRIVTPPGNPYFFGKIAAVDMETEQTLACVSPGKTMEIRTDSAVDLGVAWGRLGAPAVRLRFLAEPGRTYTLRWLKADFGAGMSVEEHE